MRAVALIAALGLITIIGGAVAAWHSAIAPVTPPTRQSFAADEVARGATLAAIADCAVCHTTEGGRAFAGGRGVPTPIGTIYATNITPDPDTGIGRWSQAAFRRAMREGIARDGSHLYPALPYPHFTRATDEDIDAVYAFLMTRNAVHQETPPNRLPFPLDRRVLLAGWNLLYFRPSVWQPDPEHDAQWNRGAYLVEGVGHCGACHTPHNALGAEETRRTLAGGYAEGWYAPALQRDSPAALPWTDGALAAYLRTGYAPQHGAAAGPMTAVTETLATVPDEDVQAIAVYIAAQMPKRAAAAAGSPPRSGGDPAAAMIFAGACGSCHGDDAPMMRRGEPSLSLGSAVNAPTPRAVIQVILHGIPAREATAAPYMPGFEGMLTDAQITALTNYVRTRFSGKADWSDVGAEVAKSRSGGGA
jgi:mono/diheme cytochrome c family protein